LTVEEVQEYNNINATCSTRLQTETDYNLRENTLLKIGSKKDGKKRLIEKEKPVKKKKGGNIKNEI
jgi:hypothetical protein